MNELRTFQNATITNSLISKVRRLSEQDAVHRLIVSRLPKHSKPLAKAAAHHFKKPGKLLRSKMAMQGSEILNVNHAAALRWAAAVEVLHNASLLHDDICDGDKQRRGQQAVWTKFGRNIALTLGDWLIALAFELAAEAAEISKAPRLLKVLAQHMSRTTAGEAMEFERDGSLNWETYLTIAADKTAPLLTAPLQGIVVMAGDHKAEQTITAYFRDLGEAYQISNDISNFYGSDGAKLIAGDLARRTPNAVTLSFVDNLSDKDQASFENWYWSDDTKELLKWRQKIIDSVAIKTASKRMFLTLDRAARKASHLPLEILNVTTPVHGMILQTCTDASNSKNA